MKINATEHFQGYLTTNALRLCVFELSFFSNIDLDWLNHTVRSYKRPVYDT